jgi:hypothetical protein
MFFFAPSMVEPDRNKPLQLNYHSVEFPLHATQPLYQFKLWPSKQNAYFLLAKDGSELLSQLTVGHILPMKYYSADDMRAINVHDTKIIEIVNETDGRFQGHCRIELDILEGEPSKSPDLDVSA